MWPSSSESFGVKNIGNRRFSSEGDNRIERRDSSSVFKHASASMLSIPHYSRNDAIIFKNNENLSYSPSSLAHSAAVNSQRNYNSRDKTLMNDVTNVMEKLAVSKYSFNSPVKPNYNRIVKPSVVILPSIERPKFSYEPSSQSARSSRISSNLNRNFRMDRFYQKENIESPKMRNKTWGSSEIKRQREPTLLTGSKSDGDLRNKFDVKEALFYSKEHRRHYKISLSPIG